MTQRSRKAMSVRNAEAEKVKIHFSTMVEALFYLEFSLTDRIRQSVNISLKRMRRDKAR